MATMPELIAVLAEHRVDNNATLELFGRRLREAGRVTKGKRGRGAAHMSYLDAARFLIACAATDHPERAVDAENEHSAFGASDITKSDASPSQLALEPLISLDQGLAKLLEWIANGIIDEEAASQQKARHPDWEAHGFRVAPTIEFRLWRGGTAIVRVLDLHAVFHHPALIAMVGSIGPDGGGYPVQKVAQEAFERESRRFATGKNIAIEFRPELLRAVASLIGPHGND